MILPINEFIDRLTALTPLDQGNLLAGLNSARQSALYSPPEHWHEIRWYVRLVIEQWAAGDELWAQQLRSAVAEDLAAWNQIHQKRGGEALTSNAAAQPVLGPVDQAVGVAGEAGLQFQRPEVMPDPAGQLDHPLGDVVAEPPLVEPMAEPLVPAEVAGDAGAQTAGLVGGEAADAGDDAVCHTGDGDAPGAGGKGQSPDERGTLLNNEQTGRTAC